MQPHVAAEAGAGRHEANSVTRECIVGYLSPNS